MEEPGRRRRKATRVRKTERKGEREEQGGMEKKRISEFIDQRCRLAVSGYENATEEKRDYGNLMVVSLFFHRSSS